MGVDSITPREHEVLDLIWHGLTNREIGVKLGISVRTVEVHRMNLMRRWQVNNVAQLLRAAFQRKVLKLNRT
jgi:DNA-binding NarL/FixJ family response regulator